jgi:hypothetical protein
VARLSALALNMGGMASATAAKEPTVSRPDASDVWMAMRHDLRLVIEAIYPIYGPGGRVVGQERGKTIRFQEGVLRVPHKGKVKLEDGSDIDAATIRSFLENHRLVGDLYQGFWRVDPVAPPVQEEELEALLDAALRLDIDQLRRIAEDERSGWGREPVIRRAEDAIAKIEAMQAEQAKG